MFVCLFVYHLGGPVMSLHGEYECNKAANNENGPCDATKLKRILARREQEFVTISLRYTARTVNGRHVGPSDATKLKRILVPRKQEFVTTSLRYTA